jgi:hypothetical protein
MNNKQFTKQRLFASASPRRLVTLFAVLSVSAMTGMACIWSLFTDHSVRFHSFRSGRGFYRLPPLPIMYDSKTGKEIAVNEAGETDFLGSGIAWPLV